MCGQGWSSAPSHRTDDAGSGTCPPALSERENTQKDKKKIGTLLQQKISELHGIAEDIQFATPNIMALDMCKDSYKENHTIFPNAQIIERYEDTSSILDFDYEMMIEEMWDNILSE